MPTITIDTPALPVPRRRAVAVRLTRWLSGHGVTPAHVVVRFVETPQHSAFSGGMSLDALPHGDSQVRHASVVCCVGPDRDEAFREGLAREVSEALGATEETPFLYVEFRPTAPSHVYLARGGRLQRADRTAARTTGAADTAVTPENAKSTKNAEHAEHSKHAENAGTFEKESSQR